jgi:hypothetical protein
VRYSSFITYQLPQVRVEEGHNVRIYFTSLPITVSFAFVCCITSAKFCKNRTNPLWDLKFLQAKKINLIWNLADLFARELGLAIS